MTERRPNGPGWIPIPIDGTPIGEDFARGFREVQGRRYRILACSAWQFGFVRTISAVEEAERDRDERVVPHDHVSVSSGVPGLLSSALNIARAAYGLQACAGVEVHGEPYDMGRHADARVVHLWRERS